MKKYKQFLCAFLLLLLLNKTDEGKKTVKLLFCIFDGLKLPYILLLYSTIKLKIL